MRRQPAAPPQAGWFDCRNRMGGDDLRPDFRRSQRQPDVPPDRVGRHVETRRRRGQVARLLRRLPQHRSLRARSIADRWRMERRLPRRPASGPAAGGLPGAARAGGDRSRAAAGRPGPRGRHDPHHRRDRRKIRRRPRQVADPERRRDRDVRQRRVQDAPGNDDRRAPRPDCRKLHDHRSENRPPALHAQRGDGDSHEVLDSRRLPGLRPDRTRTRRHAPPRRHARQLRPRHHRAVCLLRAAVSRTGDGQGQHDAALAGHVARQHRARRPGNRDVHLAGPRRRPADPHSGAGVAAARWARAARSSRARAA